MTSLFPDQNFNSNGYTLSSYLIIEPKTVSRACSGDKAHLHQMICACRRQCLKHDRECRRTLSSGNIKSGWLQDGVIYHWCFVSWHVTVELSSSGPAQPPTTPSPTALPVARGACVNPSRSRRGGDNTSIEEKCFNGVITSADRSRVSQNIPWSNSSSKQMKWCMIDVYLGQISCGLSSLWYCSTRTV